MRNPLDCSPRKPLNPKRHAAQDVTLLNRLNSRFSAMPCAPAQLALELKCCATAKHAVTLNHECQGDLVLCHALLHNQHNHSNYTHPCLRQHLQNGTQAREKLHSLRQFSNQLKEAEFCQGLDHRMRPRDLQCKAKHEGAYTTILSRGPPPGEFASST